MTEWACRLFLAKQLTDTIGVVDVMAPAELAYNVIGMVGFIKQNHLCVRMTGQPSNPPERVKLRAPASTVRPPTSHLPTRSVRLCQLAARAMSLVRRVGMPARTKGDTKLRPVPRTT
ncbi:hypothetical protein L1887_16375 [Cichorium endivia]|nr:hypothetical protein L1887_16375 [Cichorium endivia]